MYNILRMITDVVLEFMMQYNQAKREKNIIDFNDIEHFALNILVEKNEEGKYIPTEVAKEYREKFEEIAIDEYQDSNLVQEYILTTISRKNNIFMVGDIKQSIYKFRQARLELFLEKYNTYKDVEERHKDFLGTRIQLFQNFRSRKNILDVTNLVFEDIMSNDLGNVDYNETEFLNLGAEYEDLKEHYIENAELHIIDNSEKEEIDEVLEIKENSEIEAEFVANKVKEIIQSNYYIYDKKKKQYRKVEFKDIVILMRKTTDVAPIYERKLAMLNYPVFCDTAQNYFETIEIQTIISLLKVIDNPYNDIELVTVLRSPIVGLTDNELVEIRNKNRQSSFYEAVCESKEKNKVSIFLEMLEELQIKQEYLKLDELIWYIYEKTGYYNYVSLMPDGNLKTANLKMLFEKAKDYEQGSFKGLYNFINFINRVSKSNSDMGAPKLIGENENVIRIMSIHKSKGLEFPIVFLCGTGKQFNMQDLRENILLHQDLGFGPKYINYERKIEYSTLAKEAIIINAKNEIMSEEMRLLYVALTRSREKLIITGIDNNLQESLKEKREMLSIYSKDKKIDKYVVSKAKSYLDWLEMISVFDNRIKDIMKIEYHNKKVDKIENNQKDNKLDLKNLEKVIVSPEIDRILNWEYRDKELAYIEGKSSVSKITKEETKKEVQKPKFLDEVLTLTKAEIGTTVHLVMQKLDFNQIYTEEKIKELLEDLNKRGIITEKQKQAVNIPKILNFTKSNLFSNIKNAKLVFREEPFYINISANEIYQNGINENILVQGIIDLYYIDQEDNVILIDYKTDYVPEKNEEYLIEKYAKQLNLYKIALEKAIKKEVNKVYIYSTFLDKEIEISS